MNIGRQTRRNPLAAVKQDMTDEKREIMTPTEVAREFNVDPKTVSRWANALKIPSFRTMGGHRRFYRADVDAHIQRTSQK